MAMKSMKRRKQVNPRRAWTAAEDDRVLTTWGHVPCRDLAVELKRTRAAIKQRAAKLGLNLGLNTERHYTAAELQLVREQFSTKTAPEIAEQLFGSRRSASTVYRIAHKLGLCKMPRLDPALFGQVRDLYDQQNTDAEIGRKLGLSREQVTHIRHTHLKLPKHAGAIYLAQCRAVRTQLERLGVSSAGGLRALSYRRYAVENGWPAELRPREVQILNVLADRGVPMTKHELAEAIGMPTSATFATGKRRILLASNGPGGTYTADLLRRCMLQRIKRAVSGRGRGANLDLYILGPAALSILEERAKCESNPITA
jgi:hypothetical protein